MLSYLLLLNKRLECFFHTLSQCEFGRKTFSREDSTFLFLKRDEVLKVFFR